MDMCRRTDQGCDGAANPFKFAIFDKDITFIDLNFTGAQAFNFPSFENQARFEVAFDGEIKAGFSVAGDGVVVLFFLWFLSHGILKSKPGKSGWQV